MNNLNKLLAASFTIVSFGTYALMVSGQTTTPIASAATGAVAAQPVSATPTVSTAPADTAPTPSVPAPVVAAEPQTKKGRYADGTYTGVAADAFYGTVQVKVTVADGLISDITFLSYPSDRHQSQQINQYAMSGLVRQAIALQSSNVSGVSGATDTTVAFRQSLSSALAQAA